jgi:HSP20 family protein
VVERSHTAGLWPAVYEPLKRATEKVAEWFAPKSDAAAVSDGYLINVELPGVAADDIDISIHEQTLVVRGEKRSEREQQGQDYFFSEREFGTFMRSFRLPPDANLEAVDAEFRNGVLTVAVPRLAMQAGGPTRKVPVRT